MRCADAGDQGTSLMPRYNRPRLGIMALIMLAAAAVPADAQSRPDTAVVHPEPAATEDLVNPDRPGIADGSRVIKPGQFQIEAGLQQEYRHAASSDATRTLFTPTLLRVGITRRVEARLEGNFFTWMRTRSQEGLVTRSFGFAPVSLGFKYQLYDSNDDSRLSLGTIIRIFPPSGSSDFRSHHYTGDVRIAGDWDFAPKLSLNPNIGVARSEDGDGRTFVAALGALTLNYSPTARFNPFLDMGYQSPEQPDQGASVVIDAGIAYIVGRDIQIDLSAGRGVHGTTPPRPFLAIGLSRRLNAFSHP